MRKRSALVDANLSEDLLQTINVVDGDAVLDHGGLLLSAETNEIAEKTELGGVVWFHCDGTTNSHEFEGADNLVVVIVVASSRRLVESDSVSQHGFDRAEISQVGRHGEVTEQNFSAALDDARNRDLTEIPLDDGRNVAIAESAEF